MRQKSLNENIKAREQSKGDIMTSNIDDIDELLDDEGWDILNSLTEEELASLNSDFDPENMLIPTGERVNHERHIPGPSQYEKKEVKPQFSQKDLVKTMDSMSGRHQRGERQEAPAINSTLTSVELTTEGETMFNQKDLVASLNKMVEQSKPVIQNEKIRQKEEERQRKDHEEFTRKARESRDKEDMEEDILLTMEEELLLADATEEELIEAAALLNMNDILTSEQINAVFAGDKPAGTMKSSVKSTKPKQARITKADVETELDVVALNRNLKSDDDSLFYVCVNNQPLLERETLDLIIKSVGESKKIRHLSLSMLGLTCKRTIALSESIQANTQLETLNLDSNIIGMPGIEALMNVVSTHPSLREVKVSNQKQPFGAQGEECMASAIAKNQNILKFGYSFRQAAPRNKADRGIIRNNEIMRQKRKNGEEVYDLKTVCKIRDPWPQPWIKIKGQRLLGDQLASKVTDMGLMIDVDQDAGRESRGPKVREEREAKPLDIAALLAARASKLKGTNVANLDKETEERRKKTLLAMKQSEEDSGRVGTILKKGPETGENTQQSKTKESLSLGNNEATPPVEKEKPKEPEKKDWRKGGASKKAEDEQKIKKEEEEKKKKKIEEERKKKAEEEQQRKEEEEKRKKIEEEERQKKIEEEERQKKIEEEEKKNAEEERKRKEEEESKKAKFGAGKKIAALAPVATSAPVRRRKAKDLDDEPKSDFLAEEPKKEEPKKEEPKQEEPKKEEIAEKPLSAAEERAKALKERREALAARKAGASPKPATETAASTKASTETTAATKTESTPEASEKPLSAAEERAKKLQERRDALAARKAGQPAEKPASAASTPSASTPPAEDDKARQIRERREKLAAKKSALNNPTAEAPAAAAEKPKIDVSGSLGGDEAKPLSLKERRALLAEKKRLMGK